MSHHSHRQNYPHFLQQIIPETLVDNNSTNAQTEETNNNNNNASNTTTTNNTAKNNNLYWAKGTGFGTGSTIQQWDAERTLMQQRLEEEYVTCILQILTSYINCLNQDIPSLMIELFDHSC